MSNNQHRLASGELPQDLIDQLITDWRQQRPDLDCQSMGVTGRLIHLGALLRASATEAIAPYDLAYTDFDILATLRRQGEPYCVTPTVLMDAILLTSGAMTAALRRLEARGLIERGADTTDGRVKTVSLSKAGVTMIEQAIAVRFAEASLATKGLSEDEAQTLQDLLRKLISSLKE